VVYLPESRDVVAVIFDFDGTLVPDSITQLLQRHHISPKKFWLRDARDLIRQGYDQVHAYLNLLLRNIGKNKPLGALTNTDLMKFGSALDDKFYKGIPRVFHDLQRTGESYDVKLEFYVISSGLQEMIKGSGIIDKHFNAVYGSQLAGDEDDGVLKYIKRCVTYTEKTRYLFEINKGVRPRHSHRDAVNKDVPMHKRRIPFSNMCYIGDGLTDIPCFSLVKNGVRGEGGGKAFAVFNPADKSSARRTLQELLMPHRVESAHKPSYRPSDELGSLLRATVASMCGDVETRRVEA